MWSRDHEGRSRRGQEQEWQGVDKDGTRRRGRDQDARRDDEDVNEGNVRWQEVELMTVAPLKGH